MSSQKLSVYTYLGAIIVFVVVLVVAVSSFFNFQRDKAVILDQMRFHSEESMKSLRVTVGGLIEAYAIHEYEQIIETEINQHRFYEAIIVRDRKSGEVFGVKEYVTGKIRVGKRGVVNYDQENASHRQMVEKCFMADTSEVFSNSGAVIGSLTVCSSSEAVDQALENVVRNNVIYAISFSVLLVALLFFAIRKAVLNPISDIVAVLQKNWKTGSDSLDVPTKGPLEVSILGSAINRLFEQVHERERDISTLIERVHTAVVVHDAETRIVRLNPVAEELLGLSESQLLGKTAVDKDWYFFNEDGKRSALDEYPVNRVMKSGKPVRDLTLGIYDPDKSDPVWVIVNAEPLRNEKGDIISVIVSFSDITTLKSVEESLRQSESRFRSLVENMPAMVFLKDAEELRFELFNSAGERLLGYNRDSLLGKNDYDFFDKEQADFFIAKDREVLESHQVVEIPEEPITVSDGSTRLLQTFKTGLYDADGKPTHLLGISVDITEKRRIEALALKLTKAIEQSGEAVMITDTRGRIEFVNRSFCELTGYSHGEVINQTPGFLKSGLHSDEFYTKLWQQLLSEGGWQGRIQNRKKDGAVYPALLTISAIENENGEVVNYLGIQRDLTEFEELEEKFRQAQKMEAVGTLVGGIAHDFNNMLAGITGNLFLIKRNMEEQPEITRRLDTIETLSFRAAGMIKQLLTFSRSEHVELGTISIGSFLKEFLKLHRVSVPENISLESSIPDPSILINGDVTQLQQVMLNLINNARDALEGAESPRIEISVERVEADDTFMQKYEWVKSSDLVRVSVRDNGCGIAAERIGHLFEPFYTTKPVGKGTGLGLAMVYGAIRTHGGVVEVESEEGQGSAFNIYLPVVKKAAVDEQSNGEEIVVQGHGETILLADDDEAVRETATDVLQSMGYRVLSAKNGREAVALFKAHPEVKLLLFDVVMPELGGMEAVEEIRKFTPDIRVVFSTGYKSGGHLEKIADSLIINKPFKFADLGQKVSEMLNS